jgi:hypothetical protein
LQSTKEIQELEQKRKVPLVHTFSNKYDDLLMHTKLKQQTRICLTKEVIKEAGDGYLPGN